MKIHDCEAHRTQIIAHSENKITEIIETEVTSQNEAWKGFCVQRPSVLLFSRMMVDPTGRISAKFDIGGRL
jgi:predicted XRE-type DNA-binding protein